MAATNFTISRFLQSGLVVSLVLLVAATSAAAVGDEILECAKIEANDQRLACFDGVAEKRQRRIDSGEIQSGEEEAFELKARVERCEKSADERYFFYLDNGQVWKQTRTERDRYRDCNFPVTITKDFFGYKMMTEDGERAVRVKRMR